MKPLNYVKSLLGLNDSSSIIEDLRLTEQELQKFAVPLYKGGLQAFPNSKFNHPAVVAYMEVFKKHTHGSKHFMAAMNESLDIALKNIEVITEIVQKTFNDDVSSIALTYRKASVMQFSECLSFVSKFSRRFLNYIYVAETSLDEVNGSPIEDALNKRELEWLNANFLNFCLALNVVRFDPRKVEGALDDIPDVVITDDNYNTVAANAGTAKLDPFCTGFIPVALNPIYHVRMFIAEWQNKRFVAAKDEREMIQLRKLNLERINAGKPDAGIQKEIKYLEGRIADLNFDIEEMEKKNA